MTILHLVCPGKDPFPPQTAFPQFTSSSPCPAPCIARRGHERRERHCDTAQCQEPQALRPVGAALSRRSWVCGTPSTCPTRSTAPPRAAGWELGLRTTAGDPGGDTDLAKPSSRSSAVSVSLPEGGGAGRVQADQSNRSSSTTLHSRCLVRQLQNRRVKSQVALSHPEPQRQGIRKKKMVLFLALALFTNVVPGLLTTVGQFRKAKDLP